MISISKYPESFVKIEFVDLKKKTIIVSTGMKPPTTSEYIRILYRYERQRQ